MTPVEKMHAAAKKHSALVKKMLSLSREEREMELEKSISRLESEGRYAEALDLHRVREYLELQTLSALVS